MRHTKHHINFKSKPNQKVHKITQISRECQIEKCTKFKVRNS